MTFYYALSSFMEALKLLTVILATTECQIINAETQTSINQQLGGTIWNQNNLDFKSFSLKKDSQDSSEVIKDKLKIGKDRNDDFLSQTPVHKNGILSTKEKTSTARAFIYSFQTMADRLENQNLSQFDDRSFYLENNLLPKSFNPENDSQDSSKVMEDKFKIGKDRSDDFLHKTTVHENENLPNNEKTSTASTFIYSFQTMTGRFENHNLHQFDDRSLFLENNLVPKSFNPESDSQDSSKVGRNYDFLHKTTVHKNENLPNNEKTSTAKTTIYSFQTTPNRLENQNLHQFDERSRFLQNMLLPRIMNRLSLEFRYKPEKSERNMEHFYPKFHHRNNYNDYAKSIYHPHLHKRYGLRNLENNFIDKGNKWEELILGSHDNNHPRRIYYPSERSYMWKRAPHHSKSCCDNSTHSAISFHENGAAVKSYFHESKNKRHDETSTLHQRIGTVSEVLNIAQRTTNSDMELLKPKSLSPITKFDRNKLISSFKDSPEETQKGHFKLLERDTSTNFHNENSDENITEIEINKDRFEHSDLNNSSQGEIINLLSSNRVYYEKIPLNSNLSWYVYVNCSRDNCQLTNSTNETELIDQGWILHNCTNYGCSEMYPKTESVQKFIGLMLLVLSLCTLKIVAFLLVFYYCRRIKMTKLGSDEQKRLTEKEDEPNSSFETGRKSVGMKREIAARRRTTQNIDEEPSETQHKGDIDVSQGEKYLRNSFQQPTTEVNKPDSKIWVPPILKASPCLIDDSYPAGGDVLVPEGRSEKEVKVFENSEDLPKPKRKGRSGIPRLAKWSKSSAGRLTESESKQWKNGNCTPFSPECAKHKEKGELLLMDLDDEICTGNVYPLGNIENSPDWESFVENDCKSFIRLDLGAGEGSRK